MLQTLIRKEILLQLYSAKFITMLLLVILLAVASSLFMIQDYQLRLENYEVITQNQSSTGAIKAPASMSVLVKGLDEVIGRSYSIWRGMGRILVGSSQSAENKLFHLFRQLDFQFIVAVVLSLAAILFTFDSFSGEKHEGTLKLKMANAVSRSDVVLSKWLSLVIVTLIPYLIAFLIVMLFIFTLLPDITGGDFAINSFWLFLAGAIYITTFVSIGMLISSLNRNRATSMVFGLLIWSLLVFAVPTALAAYARNSEDYKSLTAFATEDSAIWFGQAFKQARGDYDDTNSEFARDSSTLYANLYTEFNNVLRRQIDTLQLTAYISPYQAFQLLSWSIASTGPHQSIAYNQSLIRYQQQLMDDLIEQDRKRAGGRELTEEESQFSKFSIAHDDLKRAEESPLLNAAILIIFTIVAFASTVFIFNRYDVR